MSGCDRVERLEGLLLEARDRIQQLTQMLDDSLTDRRELVLQLGEALQARQDAPGRTQAPGTASGTPGTSCGQPGPFPRPADSDPLKAGFVTCGSRAAYDCAAAGRDCRDCDGSAK